MLEFEDVRLYIKLRNISTGGVHRPLLRFAVDVFLTMGCELWLTLEDGCAKRCAMKHIHRRKTWR